ncbi:amino acid dehydrogenase [Caballeronia mineralivorans PML1(12)]|uniref:Amino acid dehydrogenase n=1 Tax=Caballeronia mineralivorans PML1(12) TaxID=908627 RepID=A0A0J1CWL3_9BURK|nr:D-amino acid dehydrogenase [Caballeronia mineralivorans]KLU24952.1 amino acid dehydrogenase [Caballeronia mineralivorans PML1(12)]
MKTVVLGGGIVGVTTAYFLAKAGDEVVVVDRCDGVALETSFANAGLIAPGHSYTWASPRAPKILLKSLFAEGQALRLKLTADWRMWAWCWLFLQNCTVERSRLNTSRKVRLCRYSQRLLQQMTQDERLIFDRISGGLLYLYRDPASFERGVSNMSILADNGLPLQTLDRRAVVALEPALAVSANSIEGAIYCPSDESGDAHLFTRELALRCQALGVEFQLGTTIRKVHASADRIDYVDTSQGRVSGDRYVLALGSYSPFLARQLGYRLPIYPVKGYSVTLPIDEWHEPPTLGGVEENQLVAWARFGQRLRLTATAEFCGYDTNHSPADFSHMLQTAQALFPNGADYRRPSYWAGLRPMTPEGTPLIGPARHGNLFFNTGHGHMGWTMSCGTAKILVDMMSGRRPDIDITGMTLQ